MLSEELIRATRPAALFHGLSLTASDPVRLTSFWREALGGPVRDEGDGRLRVDPAPGRPDNEILRVRPAAVTGPDDARVHVDLALPGADPGHLLAAGATLVRSPGPDPWFVLADPEGNEFCAFPSRDDRPAGIFELVVKCQDPARLSRWWAAVIGGTAEEEGEAYAVTGSPGFPWDFLVFDPVPGIRARRARLHWHVNLRDGDPGDLLDRGAVVITRPDAPGSPWVLADPEGNEFCAAPADNHSGR